MAIAAKRQTVDQLLVAARARITRYEPAEAFAALESGALLIDIRSDQTRRASRHASTSPPSVDMKKWPRESTLCLPATRLASPTLTQKRWLRN